mmetsp:Transcript_2190/g.5177  ORF Transcript_2190/g.5177 Transcript_2190/m.5177 type:complete len:304 (+) Transcript_2190:152-1063(+)|eukprot:CAMPEP_0206480478 /NCGR_PEP_ID=MMETSP0324_2-20121206/37362_1 /ASSEMBLY_ACC=CAM_ASM_000836 /TAXON_ID=2866 /ORGANISM="Crypthecodinium cohnii, Strain Seligo" /LENGTH=303 /DNA_ID=CAMNT_0053957361 /DNA_START=58 /DNA_END=969 /DNA_ORIENTATION=-
MTEPAQVASINSAEAPIPTSDEKILQKPCNCVGIRSCALCADPGLREALGLHQTRGLPPDVDVGDVEISPTGELLARFPDGRVIALDKLEVPLSGFEVYPDIVKDQEEERSLLESIEAWPWQPSQSGRWKQDFGPRANFKKQLVKVPEHFQGFPSYAFDLLQRACDRSETLRGFEAVECLLLKYEEERGANHDFHVDDTWLWGERIVGITLGSSSVFTFYEPKSKVAVRVPLPQRSGYLISGRARYDWQHGILCDDIREVRIAITYRELTEELAETDLGKLALERAKHVVAEPPKEEQQQQQH